MPPPPASPAQSKTRRNVIFAFWAVIFLGLPLWWKTTNIYRAKLPLELMDEWSDGKACKIEFPIPVAVRSLDGGFDLEGLIRNAQHHIDDANDFNAHHLRLHNANDNVEFAYTILLNPLFQHPSLTSTLHHSNRTLVITYPPQQYLALPEYLSRTILTLFASERRYIRSVLHRSTNDLESLPEFARRVVRGSRKYQVTFSLLNGGGEETIESWDIAEALQLYLEPLIETLGAVANLTVDSQVQFYAGLTFEPELQEETNEFLVPLDKLPGFVNSAEWNLATAIISYPVINFILYIPHPSIRPLHLESTDSTTPRHNSFFLPQWGGIQILNPPSGSNHLDVQSLRPAFSTFITHLLSLLGTPGLPDSIPSEGKVILSPWQLDGLVRQRAAENIVAAGGTMGALARLVRKIPNMAIPQEIRSDVLLTLSHLDKVFSLLLSHILHVSGLTQTCAALHSSAFNVALQHSSLALEYAEKAFFDDKMVSMLYFPDEHKYAIYTPLFGPLALPLLMALLKELQGMFNGWKARRLKPDEQDTDALNVKEGKDGESKMIIETTEPLASEGTGLASMAVE